MSDQIVKQLRETGDRLPLVGDTGTNLHLAAANEIERLQGEVDRLKSETTERDSRTHIISPQVFEDMLKERDELKARSNLAEQEVSQLKARTAELYILLDEHFTEWERDSGEWDETKWHDRVSVALAKHGHVLADHNAGVIKRALDHAGIPVTEFRGRPKDFAEGFNFAGEALREYANQLHRQAEDVNVVEKNIPPLMSGVNRPVLWHYQLDSINTETLNVTNAVVIYSDIDTEIDPSGQHGNRQFTTVAITRAELRTMLKRLDDDIEQLQEHCPETGFS